MLALDPLLRHLFWQRHAELWLGTLNPLWSLSEVRARIVAITCETADTKTFLLQPNRHWRGHRAGQFTMIEVEIDGVRVRRCYSISSPPHASRPAITVKRVHQGQFSAWLHDHARVGQVIGLSPAAGAFVLPEPTPARLLFLSGGSGITPVMSMLRDLEHRGGYGDVVLVHYARHASDVIFARELAALSRRHPGLRVELCLDDDPRGGGGFAEDRLARLVPDFAQREAFLCGPAGLMARVETLWARADATGRLRREQFSLPSAPAHTGEAVSVHLARSARTVALDGSGSLLEQLERAGAQPTSGCRIGICHTCVCRKRSGTVQNTATGAISSAPDEWIQLCVSTPRSDLELSL